MAVIDSDSVNRGSTPRPPANDFNDLLKPPFKSVFNLPSSTDLDVPKINNGL